MPEEITSEQTVDEFAGIDQGALDDFMSGATDEISVATEEETEQTGESEGVAEKTFTAEEMAQVIKSGIADGIAAGSQNNQSDTGANAPDFLKQYEDGLTEEYMNTQKLDEEGARFMAQTVVKGMKPMMQLMARGFQEINQRSNASDQNSAIKEVDRTLNSLLDTKGITDIGDRQDIIDLTKMRSSDLPNPTTESVRIEFEKIATKHLRRLQSEEDGDVQQVETDNRDTPPRTTNGKIGFEDIVQKVKNSRDPKDDIGGERFTALAERMLESGMRAARGGGQ
jgi:hypothetical protein